MSYPQPPEFDGAEDCVSDGSFHDIPSQIRSTAYGSNPNQHLQRSFSTPDGAAADEHGQANQSGERRRNKLGYQRTSVACNHCRHRKIRCIPSQDDAQGRCAPCIRLKKECSFMASEGQQDSEAASRNASQQQTGHRSSASSSPTPLGVDPSQPAQRQFPILPTDMSHVRPSMAAVPGPDGAFDSRMSVSGAHSQYDFAPNVSNWMNPNINPYLEPGNHGGSGWNPGWQAPQIDPSMTDPNLVSSGAPAWGPVPGAPNSAWGGMAPARSMSYSSDTAGNSQYAPMMSGNHPPPGFGGDPATSGGYEIDPNSTAGITAQSQTPWGQPQALMEDAHRGFGGGWVQPDGHVVVSQSGSAESTPSSSRIPRSSSGRV